MSGDLLNIKIKIPPSGTGVLQRPSLIEGIEKDLVDERFFNRQVTLVSAPAGFGKTTLVRQWLTGKEDHSAWFSIDSGDNERARFWRYLVSALQTVNKDLGKGTLEMEESTIQAAGADENAEVFLAPLLNDLLEVANPIILVLDDYHLIDNPGINKDMAFFIENLPPTLHLVVTTRSEPPWPLARWRARGQVTEVRQKNLRFTLEESSRYFENIKGFKLSGKGLKALYGKTEGWITGLQLASISLMNTEDIDSFIDNFAGSSRHVFQFLGDEVFNRQPGDIREFLMQTSILDRFNPSICNAVTGNQNSKELLARLERSNLFLIPLDEKGTWYRYHPLFADLLFHNLKESKPDIIQDLHEKAAAWFLKAGAPGEALRHNLATGNLMKSAELLDENIDSILLKEGTLLIIECLEKFPEQVFKEFPRLIVHKAWFLMVQKGKDAALPSLELADKLSKSLGDDFGDFQGMLNVAKAYYSIYDHDFKSALQEAEKALSFLPEHNYYWRAKVGIISGDAGLFSGNPAGAYPYYCEARRNNQAYGNSYLVISAGFKIATALYYLGNLDESKKLTVELLKLAGKEGLSNAPRVGLLWTLNGEITREKGILEEAEDYIDQGLLISEPEKPSYSWNCLFKTALAFSKQDYHLALETIQEIENIHSQYELPNFILIPAVTWKARVLLAQGSMLRAEEELLHIGVATEAAEINGGLEAGYLVLCRILLSKPDHSIETVGRLIELVENAAMAGGNKKPLLEALLLKAQVQDLSGKQENAEETLGALLEIGLRSGYYQLFLDEGESFYKVLKRVLSNYNHVAGNDDSDVISFARKIYRDLTMAVNREKSTKDGTSQPAGLPGRKAVVAEEGASSIKIGPAEELSERELEVLKLLGRGMSNQQIAEELFLSLGTVKWHTSNIYGKLEVRSRAQAVALARNYKLIN